LGYAILPFLPLLSASMGCASGTYVPFNQSPHGRGSRIIHAAGLEAKRLAIGDESAKTVGRKGRKERTGSGSGLRLRIEERFSGCLDVGVGNG
jgi:hypothetical protein